MLRTLRDLFGPKEGDSETLPFSSIGKWADGVEERGRSVRDAAIAVQKYEVDAALQTIRGVIPILAAAEIDGELHAKLGMVVKKSLPLYLRAMEAGMERSLPDGGEEYYTAAVEVLKGILRATTNQGRYLRAAFPDEMKAIRLALDRFGKAVNAMTEVIKKAREERAAPQAIRSLRNDVLQNAEERARQTSDLEGYARSIGKRSAHIHTLQADLETLRGSDRFIAEQEQIRAGTQAEEKAMIPERAYRNTALVLARVMERAEKSVARAGAEPAGKALHAAVRFLRAEGVPAREDLGIVLPPAITAVRQYIDDQRIPLKSREEREMFAPGEDVSARITALATSWHEAVRHAGDLRAAISASPVLAEVHALETSIATEEQRLGEEEKGKSAATERLTQLDAQEKTLKGRLEQRFTEAKGKRVTIDWDA